MSHISRSYRKKKSTVKHSPNVKKIDLFKQQSLAQSDADAFCSTCTTSHDASVMPCQVPRSQRHSLTLVIWPRYDITIFKQEHRCAGADRSSIFLSKGEGTLNFNHKGGRGGVKSGV
ncbi:hypothetical protein DPMN_179087 [Dreissena polymorpha]|uniref:Uncharacterized protein n=1 Tax=Dreissena polymorpha TaxID=45954 RepID=A0A9D4EBS2_DREPO|nr:hypothetical protein DPMN_179087 [Dreissena polymorpha]